MPPALGSQRDSGPSFHPLHLFHKDLGFHSGKLLLGEEVVEEVDEEDSKIQQQQNSSSSATSRRMVDRPGRPWCTNVHNMHRGMAVDRAGRPQEESGRPGGRPTEVTQLSVGPGRPTSGFAVFSGRVNPI